MQALLENSSTSAAGGGPRRTAVRGVGLRRVAAALPPMLGGTLLVAIVLSAVPVGAPLLLAWLMIGPLVLTRPGPGEHFGEYMGDYRPSAWFTWFASAQPRDPNRPMP